MSVLRTLTQPLRDAYEHRDELKEKAKDLPMVVIQTALSGLGHALLITDRVRTTIKRLTSPQGDTEQAAPATPAADSAPVEEKPARREPVIFAPRPTKSAPEDTAADAGQVAEKVAPRTQEKVAAEAEEAVPGADVADVHGKPEPVIVTPAKPEAASTAPAEAPSTTAAEAAAETSSATATEAEGAAKAAGLVEPIPGYSGLTVASLRARMRGRSVEDLQVLVDYEQATSGRDEVIAMYRKRIAKLQAGS
ncbi:hypothetical protein [Acrocarpospora catenulata]|uniref:hypothetical protein n=1 Tax=Acrocarpospora catenulata TaxID=2836182 RepID=UPI001BDA082C|nr:hypothetical protein [Acrocarpospora catenulata]